METWDCAKITELIVDGVEKQTAKSDPDHRHIETRKALRDLVFLRNLITNFNEILNRFLLRARPEAANIARMLQQAIMREAVSADVERAVALLRRDGIAGSPDQATASHAERRAVIARLDCHSLRPCLAERERRTA